MEFLSSFFSRVFQGHATENHQHGSGSKSASAIVGMEFYNRNESKLLLWIEPDCLEFDLLAETEYRIELDAREYRLEFDVEFIVLYLQSINTVLRIFKRPYSKSLGNSNPWVLADDYSD